MTTPRRRWSFGLRTLFAVVTVVGCWLGYSLNWIRERHAFLATIDARDNPMHEWHIRWPHEAPWPIRWFGEYGFYSLDVRAAESDQATRLFPEAIIEVNDRH